MSWYFNPSNPHAHPASDHENDIIRASALSPCGSCRDVPPYWRLDVAQAPPLGQFARPLVNNLGPAQFILTRNLPTFRQFERRPGFKYYDHPKLAHDGPTIQQHGCEWISPQFIIEFLDPLDSLSPTIIVVDKSQFGDSTRLTYHLEFLGAEALGKWLITISDGGQQWTFSGSKDYRVEFSRAFDTDVDTESLLLRPGTFINPSEPNPFIVGDRVIISSVPPGPLLESELGGSEFVLPFNVAEAYWVVFSSGGTIRLSYTEGGDVIDLTSEPSSPATVSKLRGRDIFNCMGTNVFFGQQLLTITPFWP